MKILLLSTLSIKRNKHSLCSASLGYLPTSNSLLLEMVNKICYTVANPKSNLPEVENSAILRKDGKRQ